LCIAKLAFVDCTDDLSLVSDLLKSKGCDDCQTASKKYFKQRNFRLLREIFEFQSHIDIDQACTTFCVVRAASAKFGLHDVYLIMGHTYQSILYGNMLFEGVSVKF
jgi:hypothetical protein